MRGARGRLANGPSLAHRHSRPATAARLGPGLVLHRGIPLASPIALGAAIRYPGHRRTATAMRAMRSRSYATPSPGPVGTGKQPSVPTDSSSSL